MRSLLAHLQKRVTWVSTFPGAWSLSSASSPSLASAREAEITTGNPFGQAKFVGIFLGLLCGLFRSITMASIPSHSHERYATLTSSPFFSSYFPGTYMRPRSLSARSTRYCSDAHLIHWFLASLLGSVCCVLRRRLTGN